MEYAKTVAALFITILAVTVAAANSYAAESNKVLEQEQKAKEEIMESLLSLQDNIASGVITESYGQITWTIDGEGKLTVIGTGELSLTSDSDRAPWSAYSEEILSAKINIAGMTDASYLLSGCSNLQSLDLSGFDTASVTNMSYMFAGCKSLKTLDLSNFCTASVMDMKHMFEECWCLQSLDISSFDTSSVTNMEGMFYGCTGLSSLDIGSFDTSSVTNMEGMFYGCTGLSSLDIGSFDTGNVTDMSYMFRGCRSLQSLNLSSFDTGNVTDMSYMFRECRSLQSLNLSSFDTGNVTDMSFMFQECRSLQSLDLSSFDTGNVTDMSYMFYGCESLQSLDVSSFDTGNVTSLQCMFSWCMGLKNLDISSFDTGNVTDMRCMFSGCMSLQSLDVSSFDTGNVTDMEAMFQDCESLQSLDLSNFDTSNVRSMLVMLYNCISLKQIKTPIDCHVFAELPAEQGEFWLKKDGTVIAELPQGLSKSITIRKSALVETIFDDVAAGAWYTDAVQYVYNNGIMEGNGTKFTPNGKMTRAMFVTTLYRLAGEPEITDYAACEELKDVSENAWYTDAVCWAYSTKITTGYTDTMTFGMNDSLTREQLAVFLYRYAQYEELDVSASDDLSGLLNSDKVKAYAQKEIKWAVGAGMISGLESTDANGMTVYDLAPQGNATRAQLASILMRFCDNYDI